jgi:hypothetical protein
MPPTFPPFSGVGSSIVSAEQAEKLRREHVEAMKRLIDSPPLSVTYGHKIVKPMDDWAKWLDDEGAITPGNIEVSHGADPKDSEIKKLCSELQSLNAENQQLSINATKAIDALADAYEILNDIYDNHGDCHARHRAWLQAVDGRIRT